MSNEGPDAGKGFIISGILVALVAAGSWILYSRQEASVAATRRRRTRRRRTGLEFTVPDFDFE